MLVPFTLEALGIGTEPLGHGRSAWRGGRKGRWQTAGSSRAGRHARQGKIRRHRYADHGLGQRRGGRGRGAGEGHLAIHSMRPEGIPAILAFSMRGGAHASVQVFQELLRQAIQLTHCSRSKGVKRPNPSPPSCQLTAPLPQLKRGQLRDPDGQQPTRPIQGLLGAVSRCRDQILGKLLALVQASGTLRPASPRTCLAATQPGRLVHSIHELSLTN